MKVFTTVLFIAALTGCSLFQKSVEGPRVRAVKVQNIGDDLEFYGLAQALQVTEDRLRSHAEYLIQVGDYSISSGAYADALKSLRETVDLPIPHAQKVIYIQNHFDFFEIKADEGWGKAFITGYYAPRMLGSRVRTKKFTTPIYGPPKDLLKIDIRGYYKSNPGLRSSGLIDQIRDGQLRGRLARNGQQDYVVPYYDRSEVSAKKLKAKVICYVDPVDAFFLEIQGSGEVELPNGEILVLNYADQNGHPYYPIGKALTDKIPLEEMSMQRIEEHLRSLPKKQQQEIMNLNPSFVFFRASKQRALTAFGVEAQPGRTIATDSSILPHGVLALLTYPNPDNLAESRTQYVLNHDAGGAIRGAGRVDLFWGHGDLAAKLSGGLKGPGLLRILVPKTQQKVQ